MKLETTSPLKASSRKSGLSTLYGAPTVLKIVMSRSVGLQTWFLGCALALNPRRLKKISKDAETTPELLITAVFDWGARRS